MVYFLVQFSKFYSMLFEVRSILVHLRGGPRSSQTTLWGCFPQLFLLSGTFQFPGALLFGPLAKKLGLYLACSSMHFPQLHLCPWTRNGRTERKKKKKLLGVWPTLLRPQLLWSEGRVSSLSFSVLGCCDHSCPWHHRIAWGLGHKGMEKRKIKPGISPPLLNFRRLPSCSQGQDQSAALPIGTNAHFWV